MIRVSIVRRVSLLNALGPPILTSSSSLVASIASRISSASSRCTVRFQSSRFSGINPLGSGNFAADGAATTGGTPMMSRSGGEAA